MTVKKINGQDVIWGSEGFTTIGTCLTGSHKKTAQKEPIPNETGGTRGLVIYEIDHDFTMEVLAPANGAPLVIGEPITTDGVQSYVTDVEEKVANKDFKKWSITSYVSETMKGGVVIASNGKKPKPEEGDGTMTA